MLAADELHDRGRQSGDVSGPVAMMTGDVRRGGGNRRDLFARQRDERMLVNGLCDSAREQLAIDRQRRACGHARDLGRMHHERVEPPHLFFEQTDGVVELVAAEGVAADQLGKPIGLVDVGRPDGPHFVDGDGNAAGGGLPGGLAPGQAAADDADRA